MGRVVAALFGFLGDFDRAEEATQEAFAIAAKRKIKAACIPSAHLRPTCCPIASQPCLLSST